MTYIIATVNYSYPNFYLSKHLLVLKTSLILLQRNNFTSSKTSGRRLEDMSGRRLEDIMETSKILTRGNLYLTNLNVYLTNLYFTNLSLTILRRIQKASIRSHHVSIRLILELKQHLFLKN